MQESIESRSGELLSIPLSRLVAAPRDEEGAGKEAAARIKGVSKAELARVAERDLKGQRWLPTPLRMAGETQANSAPGDVA